METSGLFAGDLMFNVTRENAVPVPGDDHFASTM